MSNIAIPSRASIAANEADQQAIYCAISGHTVNVANVIRALDASGFIIVRKGLHASLRRMVETFRPFTWRPIGAPYSQARLDQEDQIAVHAEAIAFAYPNGHLRD